MTTAKNEIEVPEEKSSGRKISHYATPVEAEEMEFIHAMEEFKRTEKQPFPSWSEALKVLKSLGYSK